MSRIDRTPVSRPGIAALARVWLAEVAFGLAALGGCLNVPDGPAPMCHVTADCDQKNGEVCQEGVCKPCVTGEACTPTNACHAGKLDCSAIWNGAFASAVHRLTGLPIAGWGLVWSAAFYCRFQLGVAIGGGRRSSRQRR